MFAVVNLQLGLLSNWLVPNKKKKQDFIYFVLDKLGLLWAGTTQYRLYVAEKNKSHKKLLSEHINYWK